MPTEPTLYHSIRMGSLELPGNLFLAPVAGYSDRAFRSLCREYGAAFTYTEMVSSEALTRGSGKTEELLLRADNENEYAVQIFGGDEGRMADAARMVIERARADCVDINAGCPVPKIVKTGAGSALTRDTERLYAITRAVVSAAREASASLGRPVVPVTVKFRSGWDDATLSWKEAAHAAIEGGASAITLHPRTRAQGYEGKANWEHLAELSRLVHAANPNIPVFGSGDLFTPEAARDMLAQTSCDAVMFARGAMGNPFIFAQAKELLLTGAYGEIPAIERMAAGWRELRSLIKDFGEPKACRDMRKRFTAYSKGIEGGAHLRSELVMASTSAEYRDILARYGLLPESAH